MSHLDAGAPYIGDPDRKAPEGLVQSGGYCAPAQDLDAATLPPISVQRGGMKFGPINPDAAKSLDGFRVYQHERTKRHKATMDTIRGSVFLLVVAALLLALGRALPWQ